MRNSECFTKQVNTEETYAPISISSNQGESFLTPHDKRIEITDFAQPNDWSDVDFDELVAFFDDPDNGASSSHVEHHQENPYSSVMPPEQIVGKKRSRTSSQSTVRQYKLAQHAAHRNHMIDELRDLLTLESMTDTETSSEQSSISPKASSMFHASAQESTRVKTHHSTSSIVRISAKKTVCFFQNTQKELEKLITEVDHILEGIHPD